MMKHYLISVIISWIFASTALAQSVDEQAAINDYLANLRTFSARFYQSTDQGAEASGYLYMDRPGKMRVVYDKPSQSLLIAADGQVIFYDHYRDAVSFWSVDDSSAAIILSDDLVLGGRLEVRNVERSHNTLRFDVVDDEYTDHGPVSLTFGLNPLVLRQWSLIDARGVRTTVSLLDIERHHSFDQELFEFEGTRIKRIPFGPES